MELSCEDTKRLEKIGFCLEECTVTEGGVARLRNVNGYCYFYNPAEKKCKIYEQRPMGCYLYPVVYMANEGAVIDELCPNGKTISIQELRTNGKILDKLLKQIETTKTTRPKFTFKHHTQKFYNTETKKHLTKATDAKHSKSKKCIIKKG
jgi:Fe-S-cluster containining protein